MKIKRFLSLTLALVMVFGLIPMNRVVAIESESEQVAPVGQTTSYRWETTEGGTSLKNITTEGYSANNIPTLNGTVSGTSLSGVYGKLDKAVTLMPGDEWAIEWKSAGTWEGMLVSKGSKYSNDGNMFVYHASGTNSFTIGEKKSGTYHNNGFSIALVQAAFTAAGKTYTNGDTHVFRIENRVDGNTNVPYLIIDGVEIGAMTNCYHGSSGTVNSCGYGMAGKTITLNYFGANGKALTATNFEYLEITGAHAHSGLWVEGETGLTRTCDVCGAEETVDYTAYRWEINEEGNAFQSVASDEIYTENKLTQSKGSITDGVFSNVLSKMNTAVTLQHDKPWVIEWKASGDWDGMLLSTGTSRSNGMSTLFRKGTSSSNLGLGMGTYNGSVFPHYGVTRSTISAFMSDVHTFRLENRVANDGSAQVYLVIDDTTEFALTSYFENYKTSNNNLLGDGWFDTRDFVYQSFGMGSSHYLDGIKLEYMEIWPYGGQPEKVEEHVCDFSIEKEVVKGADCKTPGYTVWACECGETEQRANEVYGGHDYYAETEGEPGENCQTPGSNYYVCSVCGDEYNEINNCFGEHNFNVFVKTVNGDNCQTGGYNVYKCEFCEETENRPNGEAVGQHEFTLFVENVSGNCQVKGYTVYKCAHCDETDKVYDANYGEHKWDNACDTDCNVEGCDHTRVTEHAWSAWEPEYDNEQGRFVRVCDVCQEEEHGIVGAYYYDEATGDDVYLGFQKLEDALALAIKNKNRFFIVEVFVDTTAGDLFIPENVNLYLNKGVTLTAASLIADGTVNGHGILDVDKDAVLFAGEGEEEEYLGTLPVWSEEQGAFFFVDTMEGLKELPEAGADITEYHFLPAFAPEMHDALVAAFNAGEVDLKVYMTWTVDGEEYSATLTFANDAELFAKFIESYDEETGKYALAFNLLVTGTDIADEGSLEFSVYLESAAGKMYL